MDTVFIKGLELYTLIGVYDFERDAKQRIFVDVEMSTNLRAAATSDNVSDTLDYGAIAQRLADIADTASYQLLEALAGEMITMILEEFAAESVTLTMHKPDILDNVDTVGIVLKRNKTDISDASSRLANNSGQAV